MNSGKQNGRLHTYTLHPIGHIRRSGDTISLEIAAAYRPALKQLEHFSHVIALWWADQHDNADQRAITQVRPPYAQDKLTGIFATRAEYRPNPIGITTCKIKSVNEQTGIVEIYNIDAYDGTPLLDLKAYYPVCDRVQDVHIPDWLTGWPAWMPDEGLGFYEETE